MKNLILIILLLIPVNLMAKNKWETHEYILQGTFTILTLIDLSQTYTFLYTEPYKSMGYTEKNPFMGKSPSTEKFFILGITGILIHYEITNLLHYLPTPIDKPIISAWQMLYIGVEIKAIHHNYKGGIRIAF